MTRRGRRGGGKRTRGEKALQRRSRRWPQKTLILIICEGRETEPNYFRGLRDGEVVRQHFRIVVQKGKGGSCLAVVQLAIAEKEKAAARGENFDEIWCVFDVESVAPREPASQARTLAAKHEIQLALSNPCFEVWLLAHFVRTKKSFADCNKVVEELNKHWRRDFEQDYEKNDEQLYQRLAPRTRSAIDNARKVRDQDWAKSLDVADCNSATDVHVLVGRLLGSRK